MFIKDLIFQLNNNKDKIENEFHFLTPPQECNFNFLKQNLEK